MLAACRSADPDLFFPVSSTEKSRKQAAEVKAVHARDSRKYRRPGGTPGAIRITRIGRGLLTLSGPRPAGKE